MSRWVDVWKYCHRSQKGFNTPLPLLHQFWIKLMTFVLVTINNRRFKNENKNFCFDKKCNSVNVMITISLRRNSPIWKENTELCWQTVKFHKIIILYYNNYFCRLFPNTVRIFYLFDFTVSKVIQPTSTNPELWQEKKDGNWNPGFEWNIKFEWIFMVNAHLKFIIRIKIEM